MVDHAVGSDVMPSRRYTGVAMLLHWVIAILLVGNIFLGWNMHNAEGRPIEWLWQLHKSFGITVLFLTIARIIWRLMNPPPPLPDDMKPLEKRASHAVHLGFYAVMLAIPLSGWALVSASPFGVPTVLFGIVSWPHLPYLPELSLQTREAVFGPLYQFHSKLAWLTFGLLALHVIGALKHQFAGEEGVLKRMIPVALGPTRKAVPSRGLGAMIALVVLAFLAVAAAPLLADLRQNGATTTLASSGNWTVVQDQSEIRFSGTHDGSAFSGVFEDWTADITFDPDRLDEAKAVVSIATSSARTGKKLYDDSLVASEWFAVRTFPGGQRRRQ